MNTISLQRDSDRLWYPPTSRPLLDRETATRPGPEWIREDAVCPNGRVESNAPGLVLLLLFFARKNFLFFFLVALGLVIVSIYRGDHFAIALGEQREQEIYVCTYDFRQECSF